MLKKFNFLKNVGAGYLTVFITSALGLYSVPLAINYFGAKAYGIWVLASSISAYLALSNFGIPTASSAMISKSKDSSLQNEIIIKTVFLLALISLLVLFLLLIINVLYPNWPGLFGDYDHKTTSIIKSVMIIMLLGFLFRAPFQIALTAFSALQKSYITKMYDLAMIILNFVMLLLVVSYEYDVVTLAYFTTMGNIFVNISVLVHLYFTRRKILFKTKQVKIGRAHV